MNAREKRALTWLQTHSGDACFDKHGVAFAEGEHAPVYRATWNKLQEAGLIEFYGGKRDGGTGYGRLRLTDAGRAAEGFAKPKVTAHPSKFAGARNRAPLLDEEEAHG